ncbi:MAG: alginate lyase family protein [Bacteroidota bacterium]|nr:alginate lyase family protein [Bacteroidota bacterium]
MASKAHVIFWSLYHLKPSMIYWRVHRTLKGAGISVIERTGLAARFFASPEENVPASSLPRLSGRYHCEDIDLSARRMQFLRDVLILPEDTAALRDAVAAKPLLWQFHFGYHDYLLALLQREDADAQRAAQRAAAVTRFLSEWEAAFPLSAVGARRSAWHPYVLSIRIESWVRLSAMLEEYPGVYTDTRNASLSRGVEHMTRVLLRNLEKGTMANHLLRNVKALVFAGLFLDTSTGAQARRLGMKLLERELREQVLDDGCHFERSPMYHVSMTNDVLDMAEAMALAGSTVPEFLAEAVARMTDFLRRMRHPDGEIPFFNDSTRSFFLRTEEVLARGEALCREMEWGAVPTAAATAVKPRRASGLHTVGTARSWLVFDAGNVGPDYQPGHAHCDTLSYEWSLDGRRFITDTGVYHYRESPERHYSRSTAAHNTVEIDGAEQSEIWKSFRVGRRARIRHAQREERDGVVILRGTHDGYTRLRRGMLHERAVVVAGDSWIAVVDWLHGSGRHQYRSFLHLHPDVTIEPANGRVDMRRGDSRVVFLSEGPESLITTETEYYPAFGEKVPRSSVILQNNALFPHTTAYVLLLEGGNSPLSLNEDDGSVDIRLPGGEALTLRSRF